MFLKKIRYYKKYMKMIFCTYIGINETNYDKVNISFDKTYVIIQFHNYCYFYNINNSHIGEQNEKDKEKNCFSPLKINLQNYNTTFFCECKKCYNKENYINNLLESNKILKKNLYIKKIIYFLKKIQKKCFKHIYLKNDYLYKFYEFYNNIYYYYFFNKLNKNENNHYKQTEKLTKKNIYIYTIKQNTNINEPFYHIVTFKYDNRSYEMNEVKLKRKSKKYINFIFDFGEFKDAYEVFDFCKSHKFDNEKLLDLENTENKEKNIYMCNIV